MSTTMPTPGRASGIRGGHVLWGMLAFFAVIVVADATMIYKAVTTFGGVENPNAYRQGVAYNQRIARGAEQSLIGWRDDTDVIGGASPRLRVSLRDRSGAAVTGKTLLAHIGRPATNRFDTTLDLVEVAAGQYEAPIAAAHDGAWIVDLTVLPAGGADEPLYQSRRRVWIKP